MEEARGVSLLELVHGDVRKSASSSSAPTVARKGVITQMSPAGAVDQSQLSRSHQPSLHTPASRRVGEGSSGGGGRKGERGKWKCEIWRKSCAPESEFITCPAVTIAPQASQSKALPGGSAEALACCT